MRYSVARTDLLPHHVAQSSGGWRRQRVREPGPELILGPHADVVGVGPGLRQRAKQPADRFQGHHVCQRMLPISEESLDGVVEGSDPRRQPQIDGRPNGQVGVVYDRLRQPARVPQTNLVAGIVGHPGAGGEFGDRERRGYRYVRQRRVTVPALAYMNCDNLGRIDRAATADADDRVSSTLRNDALSACNVRRRCVLANLGDGDRAPAVESVAHGTDHRTVGCDRPGGDERDARRPKPVEF